VLGEVAVLTAQGQFVSDDPNVFWEHVASEVGVPLEALGRLYEALEYAPQYSGEEPGKMGEPTRHCTAAELCQSWLLYAEALYGRHDYAEVLRSWGLSKSEDLGRLVYALIDRGHLAAQEGDRPSDFDGQFDLDQA
jgi:uncharacterized repeat protein (TIGR04138 family)